MKELHRDDLTDDVAEGLVAKLKELHPGCKVVFAGDSPDPTIAAESEELQRKLEAAFCEGRCMDCGEVMPNWNTEMPDDWQPADGWGHFSSVAESPEIIGWQCPKCSAAEARP